MQVALLKLDGSLLALSPVASLVATLALHLVLPHGWPVDRDDLEDEGFDALLYTALGLLAEAQEPS